MKYEKSSEISRLSEISTVAVKFNIMLFLIAIKIMAMKSLVIKYSLLSYYSDN